MPLRIILGNDHGGVDVKAAMLSRLVEKGHEGTPCIRFNTDLAEMRELRISEVADRTFQLAKGNARYAEPSGCRGRRDAGAPRRHVAGALEAS
jgi:hypothetical protein